MKIKHSIIMITYNQEGYIRSAIDSLFRQGANPYEVIISDDCSTDSTQSIIQEYQEKYPSIIKPIFQKTNLGIYGNLNSLINNIKLRGDIISFLSGDDLFKDNLLSFFDKFIDENQLDPRVEKFMIFTNTLGLFPDGSEKVLYNNFKFRNKDPIELRIRELTSSRYTGISRKLYETMNEWNTEIGLWSDAAHSFDLCLNCENFYFINKAGPVYRKGSGVTSDNNSGKSWHRYAEYLLIERAEHLNKCDVNFLKKKACFYNIQTNKRPIYNRLMFLKYHFLSFKEIKMGYSSLKKYLYDFGIIFPKRVREKAKFLLSD